MDYDQLGPYRIVRKLGQGGMGAVYEGVDDEGNVAAIKTLTDSLANQEGFRHRFGIEIETLRKLEHPSIVRIFGFGEQDNCLFYVMELVQGWSLEHMRAQRRQLPWREAVDIGKQVCRALKHAHDRGIIHRDLKPANLMVTPSGQVKLSDFGIASMWGVTGLTIEGGILGTATYMSPEQADGQKATVRSDLYSLGCVLYALIAGRPPFTTKSVTEMLRLQRTIKPEPISCFCADVPPELETVIFGLLEKDPRQRIATAAVAARALQAVEDAVRLRAEELTVGGSERSAPAPAGPPADSPDDCSDETRPAHPAMGDGSGTQPIGGKPEPSGDDAATIAHAAAASGSDDAGATDHTITRSILPPPLPGARPMAPASPAADDRTQASAVHAPFDDDEDPDSPRSIFITAQEAAQRDQQLEQLEGRDSPRIISAGSVLMAVLIAALVLLTIYFIRPLSADQYYENISTLVADGSTDGLLQAEPQIREFLHLYPDDPRAKEVAELQEETELASLERRLQVRARRAGRSQSQSVMERLYLEALAASQTEPEVGHARFSAIIALYAEPADALSEDDQQYLELARRQVTRLEQRIQQTANDHLARLRSRMDAAAALWESDPAAAAGVCQAVVDLYGHKPWAADVVAEARAQLARVEATP